VRISDEGLRRLAPSIADALLEPQPPAALSRLDADDAEALVTARDASRRWRALVDRMPPAELLDLVLDESAYAVETRGPRARQARENLKKIRAMIRRLQNRGYTTLHRIVSHLDRLALGDEANAVIDASDSVSLMTVHAAKGLEFPVVFVVNLARGTGTRRAPIRVMTGEAGDEASVAVGDFQSSGDEDLTAREREETKRLLYVALTRARDRLYLSSMLKDGQLKPGRGSLAEVLPMGLQQCFVLAGAAPPSVGWSASSGTVHTLSVCAAPRQSADVTPPVTPSDRLPDHALPASPGDFERLADSTPHRCSVGEAIADATAVSAVLPADRNDSTRTIGTLVHRLLAREGLREAVSEDWLKDRIAALTNTNDASAPEDLAEIGERTTRDYRAFAANADVRELYQSGRALHEVPFSLRLDGRIVHGSIDCLVRSDASVTVLEFKTGTPRPEHASQADLYRRAAEALFPGEVVRARVIYARDPNKM
jgi:ATP-dependent helicase/nuclease subunit A